jgi:tRNA threonylcarbamoyladenosine biosynthesis protein TsaB
MIILGLDTSTRVCTVAVVKDGRLLVELSKASGKTHSQRLMPLVDQAIRESGLSREDIDGIAVGAGPGSFTGLRIGLAAAKGLGYALRKPAIGIPTLDSMAHNLVPWRGLSSPILDAKRGEVYAALYRGGAPVVGVDLIPLCDWLKQLSETVEPVVFLGDGAEMHRPAIASALGERAVFAEAGLAWPRGSSVADLGRQRLLEGRGADPFELSPIYLRPSQAEILWEKNRGL